MTVAGTHRQRIELLLSRQVVGARLLYCHTISYARWRLLMPLSC